MKLVSWLLSATLSFIGWHNSFALPSLREKIGQMLIVGFEGNQVSVHSPIIKAIEKDAVGGVILFDYNQQTRQFDKNIQNPQQVSQLNHPLQQANDSANNKFHRAQLPLIISIDYEGGEVSRLSESKGFPATFSAEALGKMTLTEAKGEAGKMALTLKKLGFNLDFAPVVDININPDNPIIGKRHRSFSNNAEIVLRYARAFAKALAQEDIQCAYKHFPGHGSAAADSHLEAVNVTETWQKEELLPYHNPSCGMIMAGHIINRKLDASGLPASLSHAMLTGLLRDQLQFNGVIITDDLQMRAITDHYPLDKALTLAINAGADMVILGNQISLLRQDPSQVIDLIEAKVRSRDISEQRINEAYERIARFKRSLIKKKVR